MKNICLIPARGGSKRIPNKNIKNFHGKPLIAWSIEAAKSSGLFESIYISTDDIKIAKIAKSYGAKIPFLRPKNLSNDFAIDKEVRDHFIKWMKDNMIDAGILCYLYATAPFINKETLIGCHETLVKSSAMSSITVTTFPYSPLRALKKDNNGFVSHMWDKYALSRSQDLPELLHDAGQCYFYNLSKYGIDDKVVGYQIPRKYCQDIDTLEDFKIAEDLFQISREKIANN